MQRIRHINIPKLTPRWDLKASAGTGVASPLEVRARPEFGGVTIWWTITPPVQASHSGYTDDHEFLFSCYIYLSSLNHQVPNAKHYSREYDPEATARDDKDNTLVFHPAYINEAALWGAFKKGDEKALISIFDRFANILYNYGVKIYNDGESVKDTVQDLFIELWKNRENLSDTDSIKFYLFKAVRYKLLRVKRSRARRDFLHLSPTDDGISPSPESFVIAEQTLSEQRARLMKMLGSLSPRQREAIFLRYFEEMNYDRIAGIMDMNKQSVYNLIHSGIYQLRELL